MIQGTGLPWSDLLFPEPPAVLRFSMIQGVYIFPKSDKNTNWMSFNFHAWLISDLFSLISAFKFVKIDIFTYYKFHFYIFKLFANRIVSRKMFFRLDNLCWRYRKKASNRCSKSENRVSSVTKITKNASFIPKITNTCNYKLYPLHLCVMDFSQSYQ